MKIRMLDTVEHACELTKDEKKKLGVVALVLHLAKDTEHEVGKDVRPADAERLMSLGLAKAV